MKFRLKVCQIFPSTTSVSRAGDFLTQDYHLGGGGGGGAMLCAQNVYGTNWTSTLINKHSIQKRLSLFTLSCANQLNNNLKN